MSTLRLYHCLKTDYDNQRKRITSEMHLEMKAYHLVGDTLSDLIILPGRLIGEEIRLIVQHFLEHSYIDRITSAFLSPAGVLLSWRSIDESISLPQSSAIQWRYWCISINPTFPFDCSSDREQGFAFDHLDGCKWQHSPLPHHSRCDRLIVVRTPYVTGDLGFQFQKLFGELITLQYVSTAGTFPF